MDQQFDTHSSIALMSFFQSRQSCSARFGRNPYWRHDRTKDGFRKNIPRFPVLDALACISLYRKEDRAVAIAVQLNSREKKFHLTIASSAPVESQLIPFITQLWKRLGNLSAHYARSRIQVGSEKHSEAKSEEHPEGRFVDRASSLKIEIFRDVYIFCLEKQIDCINRWWKDLDLFIKELQQHRCQSGLKPIEKTLFSAMENLSTSINLLRLLSHNHASHLSDFQWRELYTASTLAMEKLEKVVVNRDGYFCDILVDELQRYHPQSTARFPLRRAVDELTSLSHHIDILFSFACSRSSQPTLTYPMSISMVPNQTCLVRLPSTPEEWQSTQITLCNSQYQLTSEEAKKLLVRYSSDGQVCPVHCECQLITYLAQLRNDPWDKVPPFSYIGMSEPSCSACHLWIETFNERIGRQFYIQGSKGKWEWPWGMPGIDDCFYHKMGEKISLECLLLRRKEYLHKLDSRWSGIPGVGMKASGSMAYEEQHQSDLASGKEPLEKSLFTLVSTFFESSREK